MNCSTPGFLVLDDLDAHGEKQQQCVQSDCDLRISGKAALVSRVSNMQGRLLHTGSHCFYALLTFVYFIKAKIL